MAATIVEHVIHGLRWLTVSGPRHEVFRSLGRAAAPEIHAVLATLPEAEGLAKYAASEEGRRRVDAILAATRESHPRELQEALDIAEGADFQPEALLMANLRGDIGGDDGIGCSDLAWRGARSIMVHNEDGAPTLDGRFMLLTLAVDNEVPMTTQWYPGFLPSNTFVVTGHGLAWGINHIQVAAPPVAPGRHFVARALQHQPTLDAAVRYLEQHPSAGGFTYTIGELGTGRLVTIEAAGGKVATVEAEAQNPYLWHTNHLRFIAEVPAAAGPDMGDRGVRSLGQRAESVRRGEVLSSLRPSAGQPTVGWFLDVMANNSMPEGVVRSAEGDDPLTTLCTTAVDLTCGEVTIQPRGSVPFTFPAAEFATGPTQR